MQLPVAGLLPNFPRLIARNNIRSVLLPYVFLSYGVFPINGSGEIDILAVAQELAFDLIGPIVT
jgi:hypothetical protein